METIHDSWTINGKKAQVRNYASIYEPEALEQAMRTSRGAVTEGPVIMLPDAHFGSGACVGTAVMTRDGIYPAAVGVDIGCGMVAVQTSLMARDLDVYTRRVIRNNIARLVPSGVGTHHEEPLEDYDHFLTLHGEPPLYSTGHAADSQYATKMIDTAAIQFGTLGSGNHFVEVSEDEDGFVWAIVHSGSRGIGNNIARFYIDKAKKVNEEMGYKPEDRDLAYLPKGEWLDGYLESMLWAQAWAMGSRQAMMENVLLSIAYAYAPFNELERINCHHNYSELQYDGSWLTRKGAIDASMGIRGILPGSMSTDTYITTGLGNPLSYNTAPHGAGRLHARGRPPKPGKDKPGTGAWAKFKVEDFRAKMEARGVVWQDRDAFSLLDESEFMYKDINIVLKDAETLVKPTHRLVQIVNYKGL